MKLRSIDILLAYCSTAYVTVCSPSVASGDSLPFVGPQPHSVAALKTPVAPCIVGTIGCVIAVLSDAFGCTSAPFASAKGRADVPSYILPLTSYLLRLTSYLLLITMQ